MSEEIQNQELKKAQVANMGYEFFFKIILFGVTIIAFISITITLIYMGLNKYDASTIIAIGGSDGIIAMVMGIIARSLFRKGS